MRFYSGTLLMATGVLHCVAILLFGLEPLLALLQSGFVGQVEAVPLQMAVFWSSCFGAMLLVCGGLMRDVERRGHRLPGWLGWAVILLAVVGIAGIPASGFWLVLPLGARIVLQARGGAVATAPGS